MRRSGVRSPSAPPSEHPPDWFRSATGWRQRKMPFTNAAVWQPPGGPSMAVGATPCVAAPTPAVRYRVDEARVLAPYGAPVTSLVLAEPEPEPELAAAGGARPRPVPAAGGAAAGNTPRRAPGEPRRRPLPLYGTPGGGPLFRKGRTSVPPWLKRSQISLISTRFCAKSQNDRLSGSAKVKEWYSFARRGTRSALAAKRH